MVRAGEVVRGGVWGGGGVVVVVESVWGGGGVVWVPAWT